MANKYTEQPKDRFNYGDNMNSSYSGYIKKDYVIRFENARIAKDEQDVVEFKAFITAFKDLFKPEWNEETVFGRTEPIGIYKGISRRLSFAFDAPADSVVEGKDNLSKTEDLVKMLYPTYHQPGTDSNYRILSQAPLIRLSFVNIINDHKHQKGLLGYITSFDYDLNFGKDIGVFDGQEKFLTPRLISFNIDFTVLHEIPLGYGVKEGENFMDGKFASDKGWLYGVDEGEISKATKQAQKARAESDKARQKDKTAQEAADAQAPAPTPTAPSPQTDLEFLQEQGLDTDLARRVDIQDKLDAIRDAKARDAKTKKALILTGAEDATRARDPTGFNRYQSSTSRAMSGGGDLPVAMEADFPKRTGRGSIPEFDIGSKEEGVISFEEMGER